MKRIKNNAIKLIIFSFLLFFSSTKLIAQGPYLGSLGNFALLAGNNLTDNNPNIVYGLVGCGDTLYGSSASTDSTIFMGQLLIDAIGELGDLHDSLNNLSSSNATELGEIEDNMVIYEGLYFIGDLTIPSNYTITIQSNDSDAVFIFNISGQLLIETQAKIILNGVKPENVFWNSTGDQNINYKSNVSGIFISNSSIYVENGVSGVFSVMAINNVEINANQHLFSYASMSQQNISTTTANCINNCPKQNLVINGSFNSGTASSFYTDLINWESGSTIGHYNIGPYPIGFNNANLGNWSLNDHTNNGGNFFMVDGFASPPAPPKIGTIWKQSNYVVQPNHTYRFSFFIGGLTIPPNNNSADIAIYVNGVFMEEYFYNAPIFPNSLGYLPNSWVQNCIDWTANSTETTAEVEIRQVDLANVGFDYGLDDISFVDISLGPDVADAGPNINSCYQPNLTIGGVMNTCFSTTQNTYSWTPTIGLSSYNTSNPTLLPISNAINTTYTVTVVSNGNTTTDQVNVVLTPSLTLNTYEDQSYKICAGLPTVIQNNVVPTNGNGPFIYTWSPSLPPGSLNVNTANPTISLQPPTFGLYHTYTVTVSSSGYCSTSFIQKIYVDPEPDASFQNNDNGYNSISRTFIAYINNENLTYNWTFSDGTKATGRSTTKNFNGGSYNVILTVSDLCGRVVSTNQYFECSPMYNNYNPSYCADRNNIILYDITGDYPINNDTWWTSLTPGVGKIKGTVTINSGKSLTIENRTIRFGLLGKIIIKPGAKLVLDGATLTGINETFGPGTPCSTMWQGIEVWGSELYSHNGTSHQDQQGKLIMKNAATIKNAHKAIFVGKRSSCIPGFNCDATIRGIQTYEQGFGGGLINIQGSSFSNNAIDIEFAPFVSETGTAYTNRSIIKNNTFSGGTLLDPAYDLDITSSPSYPNAGNPYYASANSAGRSAMQLKSYKIYNLNIYDNSFSNAETGIFSIDSRINISKASGNGNSFTNLSYGIHTLYTGTTFDYGQAISNNKFNKINMAAIRADGGRYITIKQNDFGNSLTSPIPNQEDNPLGIYLDGCSNFNISDNTFFRLSEGIRILESGAAGGRVSTDNGTGNKFIRNSKGIVTSGNNPNLQIRCNDYNNSFSLDYNNSNWSISGVLATQGAGGDHTKPAGNEFRPETRKDIFSGTPFWYYAHILAADNTAATRPTGASESLWNENTYLQNTGIVKQATSCIPPPPCFPNCEVALNTNSAWRSYLEQHYDEVMGNLDQGNTGNLLSSLNGPTINSTDLKELLLEYSPLSELVIASMLDHTTRFTTNDFLSVLEVNMPVSSELWDEAFIPLIITLDTSSAAQLRAYQLNESGEAETLAGIEADYLQALNEQQTIIEEIALHDVDIDPNSVADLMSAQTEENMQVAASTYLSRGQNFEANNLIANIVSEYEESDWASLSNIHSEVLENGNGWFSLDSIQEVEIRRIQEESSEIKAKLNAQAVLSLLYGEIFPMRQQEQNYSRGGNNPLKKKYEFKNQNSISSLLNPYPNPANNAVYIPSNLTSNAELVICNSYGQVIDKIKLKKGYQLLKVETSNYPTGVYLFVFNINDLGKPLTKKVMIQR